MTPAGDAIRAAIRDHGPISFAEFMELALYGPGGFYEEPPVGESGHFVTSPHVHPVFARMVGRALRDLWVRLDRPAPFHVVEAGAGDGTLARDLISHLSGTACEYVAVERSPGARRRLQELPVRVAAGLEAVGHGQGACLVANELLDNLPFLWVRGTPAGLVEVRVALEGEHLAPVQLPWDTSLGDEELLDPPALADGEEAAIPIGALHLVDRVAKFLGSGYALLIDYAASGRRSPVHGYRGHSVVEDILAAPGTSDITAGVDVGMILQRATQLGLHAFAPVTQRSALLELGMAGWLQEERRRQVAFQEQRAGREAVTAWSGRHRASMLIDPNGLGRLRWLVLATPGLPVPSWAERALERDLYEGLAGPLHPDGERGEEGESHRAADAEAADAEAAAGAAPPSGERGAGSPATGRRRRRRRRRSP